MTTTPTVWRTTITVNTGVTNGLQSDPIAVETADGRIFTLWTDDTNNVEAAAGDDVVGRHGDYYQGLSQAFHVNVNVSAGDESRARVAALPDGGLFTVFNSTAGGNDVHYIRHDAAGNVVSSGSIAAGANNYNRPAVALLGNNTLAIGYTSEGTAENYGVITFDLATNSLGPRRTFDDPFGFNAGGTAIEVAALGSDRFVAIYAAGYGPTLPPFPIDHLSGRIFGPSGELASFDVPDTDNATSLQVASLFGGGFVVAYDPFLDSDFFARLYDGNGGAQGGAIDLELPGGQFGTTLHDVVGLKEGGFYVVYNDGATGALAGQRYTAAGAALGTANALIAGGADRASLSLTQDGRIIVTWSNGGDIRQRILDPRDEGLAIIGDENDNILAARPEGSWVLGGGGADRLFGWNGPDRLEGGNDGDILKGGQGADILDGGTARDTLEGGLGDDYYILGRPGVTIDGSAAILDILSELPGQGSDTVEVEFHDIPIGGGFAFFFETYTLPDNIENGIIAGIDFFQLIGNALDNRLQGNNAVNWLEGRAGNDSYDNIGAGDVITELPNAGYDTVNTALATFTLGANFERVNYTGSGNFIGTGNALNNRFQSLGGDDRFVDVAGGADIFSGGLGTDTVDFRSSAVAAILNFATGVHGGAAAGDSYSSIEKFLGSDGGHDRMTAADTGKVIYAGYGGDDRLNGGAKGDQLLGGEGSDILQGYGGRDTLDGGLGNDTLRGGLERDVFVFLEADFGQDTIVDYEDGFDALKIFSAVADDIADFSIAGNGTASVTLTLIADPANVITISGAAAITITAADIVFY